MRKTIQLIASFVLILVSGLVQAKTPKVDLVELISQEDFKAFEKAVAEPLSDSELQDALYSCIAKPESKYLKKILEKQKKAKELLKSDASFVLVAISESGILRLKELEKIVDLKSLRSKEGNTVLFESLISGDIEMNKYLIKKYPSLLSVLNKNDESVYFAIAQSGNPELAKVILKNKQAPSLSLKNKSGLTASQLASKLEYPETALALKPKEKK